MSNEVKAATKDVQSTFLPAVIVSLLLVVLWNYGGTEVIQALGGPDANVNVLDGVLAVFFISGLKRLV